ncbi:MAG: glycine cleavage system aminomethyltransferase GcvT [Candidatus Thorarchaeota archaeon]
MNDSLKRTHLYNWHAFNGNIVPFAGWEMPVRYSSIREEHMAVREGVGVFDTSHMYRFHIKGTEAAEFLQRLTTNNVSKLKVNKGQYSTCLNPQGGTHDDLMLYRIEEDQYIWITNAANGPKIWNHLKKHSGAYEVNVEDKSHEIVMIAVQGPKALTLLNRLTEADVTETSRFSCNPIEMLGHHTHLCRTGYTGEDGGEILLLDTPYNEEGKKKAISFWEEILAEGQEFGIKPCGLGARNSTRLEAGFVLYGHELDEETTPLEARIPFAVKFKVSPHYIGYDALKKQKKSGVDKTRIGLAMTEPGIPRQGYRIFHNDKEIGHVTSGIPSPVLDKGIGMAYVSAKSVKKGDIVHVDIHNRLREAKVVSWPFYDTDKYGM